MAWQCNLLYIIQDSFDKRYFVRHVDLCVCACAVCYLASQLEISLVVALRLGR